MKARLLKQHMAGFRMWYDSVGEPGGTRWLRRSCTRPQRKQAQALQPAGRRLVDLIGEVRELYLQDQRPWVVGFSGGKDSTAVLQLVYTAVLTLPPEERKKQIFVVSSDTQVETPVVIDLLAETLAELNDAAAAHDIPLQAHQVRPRPEQTFWVNLLGKGYPAPTKSFRWCTERMKINPINAFILEKVAKYGEVIVILGARRAESASRAQVIARHRIDGSRLGRHTSLPNAFVYTPIQDWTADEVWEYLMSAPRPWGGNNRALLELYKGSNAGECPIVIDTSTPSCGNSRFGCWTCTVVTIDKAMESLVEQGEDWMRPLLEFRNLMAETTRRIASASFALSPSQRQGVVCAGRCPRMTGRVVVFGGTFPGLIGCVIAGNGWNACWELQRDLQAAGHEIELITEEELHLHTAGMAE